MLNFILFSLFITFFIVSLIHESIFFSIFFLISLFLVSSFIFILLGFEFIGFLYLIVYVGAIAVLFLFMVMLFDKSEYLFFSSDSKSKYTYDEKMLLLSASFALSIAFSYFLFKCFQSIETGWFIDFFFIDFVIKAPFLDFCISSNFELEIPLHLGSNLQRIGFLLYSYFSLSVFGAGVVLLVGMIGAIVLTQTFFFVDKFKKHQEIKEQIIRKRI